MGIIYLSGMLALTFVLTVGGYILQRDKYWLGIWENAGKPNVKSIRELKVYINEQSLQITNLKNVKSEKR